MNEQATLAFQCLVVALTVQFVATSESNKSCPIWTTPVEVNNTLSCECGSDVSGRVLCNEETLQVSVVLYHCITYYMDQAVVGHCLYNTPSSRYYMNLPRLKYRNDTALCHFHEWCRSWSTSSCKLYQFNTGLMCTECIDRYSYPVYSYSWACVECKDYKYNWLKYIAVAFLPLTAFYIIVILFRISATSGALSGYVLMCQLVTTPVYIRLLSRAVADNKLLQIFIAVLGVWNLDFFRGMHHPFCLHPKLTLLQTLTLDYLIAVYPLILVIVTYICVKLHNRYSLRLVVRLWSPFYKCFALIRNNWDIKRSLVGAFSTFILLSYVKILNVSFLILTPNTLYDISGNPIEKKYLFYDGTYEYFGKDHIPYALLALFMLLVFNIIPLVLLCLYPCRCFHKVLNCCNLGCLTLHIFMDTFHGCYKLQPRDCRHFAALYLFLRVFNQFLIAVTTEPLYYPLSGFTFIAMVILVTKVKPYKSSCHTFADSVFFATLVASFLGVPDFYYVADVAKNSLLFIRCAFVAPLASVPIVYGFALVLHCIVPKWVQNQTKSTFQRLKHKLSNCFSKTADSETAETLPYRFGHSDEYPPLFPIQPVTN